MICFKDVGKSFSGKTVLEHFSFTLNKQSSVGLLGPSGTGKSTVLRLIAGLIQPDTGTLEVGSRKIAYIFQEPCLIPWKTALENVFFSVQAAGRSPEEAEGIGRLYLDKMELSEYEDYFPGQLSGGMQQRVSIARAFAVKPDILLMDEPFSALDPGLKERMYRYVEELLEENPTLLLYVTHNPEDIVRVVDSIFMLSSRGQLDQVYSGKEKIKGEQEELVSYLYSLY